MPVIINEVEVIAPPLPREQVRQTDPANLPAPGPTPHDVYLALRKLVERRLRLQAR